MVGNVLDAFYMYMLRIWFLYGFYMVSICNLYGLYMVQIWFVYVFYIGLLELKIDELLVVATEEDAGDEEEGIEEIAEPAAMEDLLPVL